jgi:hypothetical protein
MVRSSQGGEVAVREGLSTVVTTLFVRFLVLVLESIQYSNPTYWSASSREPPRSTIGMAAVRTAIEYEYRV